MAQFDVFRLRPEVWVIDCQAGLLDGISMRFVVPLSLSEHAPPIRSRLDPIFEIAGERRVMVTQLGGVGRLAERISSLASEEHRIRDALDMLISGV